MDSPADGDELARVVPLRRRDRELTAAPGARGTLPRERAPFDPEIEPYETPSGNSRPQGMALHAAHAALRRRRIPGPHDGRRADTPRRHSTVMLLTGIAGAGLATVAALLLLSILNPSTRSLKVGSVGGRVTAGALEPTTPGVLSASANPFGGRGNAATPKTRQAVALRAHHAHPKPARTRSTRTPSAARTQATQSHQSAVVASYTHGSSASSGGDAAPDTQSLAITNSTPAPVSASTPEQSTSPSQPRASSASSTNRPAFGEQGLLGPGSSPDS